MTRLESLSRTFHKVELETVTLWFSYETPIGLKDNTGRVWAVANQWGPTTGKHLNALGVPAQERLTWGAFQAKLLQTLRPLARKETDT